MKRARSYLFLGSLLVLLLLSCSVPGAAAEEFKFVRQWGTYGTGVLYDPSGVAVDGAGAIYIADSGTHQILKAAPNGTLLAKWGGAGKRQRLLL